MEFNNSKILIVDDNKSNIELMRIVLSEEGFSIVTSSDANDALRKIKRDNFDLVITDFLMPPGIDGIELTKEIKKRSPGSEVIILTAYGDIESAVRAIKSGAYDFIQRPINNDILILKVKRALHNKFLTSELEKIKKVIQQDFETQYKIIGISKSIKSILENISIISSTDSTVLITGESGTGKELFARTIHHLSNRRDKNFVAVNCGAIPETLLESEFFGYKKGAFTGADFDKAGLFQEANNGTIFLDEIGELPLSLQVKLLRVLQEREIKPIGSNVSTKINVRVIAATNRDLAKLVESGQFRSDLYYRLNVVNIHIPPLRERPDDIPVLANYFLAKFAHKYNKNISGFSNIVMDLFIKYNWPGNVREMENVIERAVLLTKTSVIQINDLPEDITASKKNDEYFSSNDIIISYKRAKEIFEKEYITRLLEYTRGNIKKASEISGKHRTDLYDMLKKYEISIDNFRKGDFEDDNE
ncbi:MAG TPA: sigma-54 dependent transcriptional regulator [Spirochaetota bacterium]|nr:sigma-54 dependent transcriptional regulator [Spirochaetota bacterium]HOM37545.1 sigma-54 dependent transcriptional regulator [Spirochaetota bacterium]HPQ49483.1 sigma-54 dependent transcriptional regulator [Spirochaetota bacterium]